MKEEDTEVYQLKWYKKRENYLIICGFIITFTAVILPFLIIKFNNYGYSLKQFSRLGTVGDFFGGTTVGLLSLASLIFVTAAMFMQKEELALQRTELAKTNKEYEITNKTMKRQSFDSTFFNMVNLHRSIEEEMKKQYNNTNTKKIKKDYFYSFLQEVKGIYEELEWKFIINVFDTSNIDIVQAAYIVYSKEYDHILENNDGYMLHGNTKEEHVDESIRILMGLKHDIDRHGGGFGFGELLRGFGDIKYLISGLDSSSFIDSYFEKLNKFRKDKNYKIQAYEKFYETNEYLISHYYRNLYRIVKYIHEYEFSLDSEENNYEKRNYLGILRAQLSSYELLMLFYNLSYSQKGEKFAELLLNKGFFDDHLVESDFLWLNDKEEVKKFKSKLTSLN